MDSDKKKSVHINTKPDDKAKLLAQVLSDLASPNKYCLDFEQEIIKSSLADKNPSQQVQNIINAFNQERNSIMIKSFVGKRIEPDQFRLVALNKKAELVAPSEMPLRKIIYPNPNFTTEDIGIFKQTDLFFGEYGSFVVNVPQGKIALAWLGNMPILLGPGPHVIHDPNLKKIKEEDLVDYNSDYIFHGTYHIMRIPPNRCAKIWINTVPYFLVPKEKPYVFNHAVFKKDEHLVKLISGYISHGAYSIIQVPRGKIAKVWLSATQPILLESREEPYVFEDPGFRLDSKNVEEYFEDATERVIIHGSIKRLLPKTGEVAVTYNNGKLVTFGANLSNEPTIITVANHSFDRFIATNIQTIEFPSSRTKEKRIQENAVSENDVDYEDVNYEVFRTSDGLPIGVKLLVVYEIENPDLTLSKLNADQIISHIEYLVVADMGLVIQNCSSVDFLKSNQPTVKTHGDLLSPVAEFYEHLQDRVFKQLKEDFGKYGIKLVRLNIETPKILDTTIASKMAEFSLMNTEARAKEGVLERNFNIARQQANQEAVTKQISQQQENDNKISIAKAEFDSAKLKANALLTEAEGRIKAQEMELEVARKRAELFEKYPGLLQFEIAKIQSESMKGISGMIISPEVASMYYNIAPSMRIPVKEKSNK